MSSCRATNANRGGEHDGHPCQTVTEALATPAPRGEWVAWLKEPDSHGFWGTHQDVFMHCAEQMHNHGWIDTPEGGHIVCPGDWIITGVQGERYPCKPDVFAATYEAP